MEDSLEKKIAKLSLGKHLDADYSRTLMIASKRFDTMIKEGKIKPRGNRVSRGNTDYCNANFK